MTKSCILWFRVSRSGNTTWWVRRWPSIPIIIPYSISSPRLSSLGSSCFPLLSACMGSLWTSYIHYLGSGLPISWRVLDKVMVYDGHQVKRSTTFHPQTDGQTEVVNRTVVHLLRGYCNKHPKFRMSRSSMCSMPTTGLCILPFRAHHLRHDLGTCQRLH